MVPVFSRREAERFTPPGSPRTYNLAPLTFRERQAFRAEMAREGGLYPPRPQLLDALREAVREAHPATPRTWSRTSMPPKPIRTVRTVRHSSAWPPSRRPAPAFRSTPR